MKKLIALTFIFVMIFSLAACGNSEYVGSYTMSATQAYYQDNDSTATTVDYETELVLKSGGTGVFKTKFLSVHDDVYGHQYTFNKSKWLKSVNGTVKWDVEDNYLNVHIDYEDGSTEDLVFEKKGNSLFDVEDTEHYYPYKKK